MIPLRVLIVVGSRPSFLKAAPLIAEMQRSPEVQPILLDTGRHFAGETSDVSPRGGLRIPIPDISLAVGPGSHAAQTAAVLPLLESTIHRTTPDIVVVLGDANSTLAASTQAVKMGIPVAHVEGGLRSFDREMPEEINRLMTDAISDFLFVSEVSAANNLTCEGIPPARIHFVGNLLVDLLLANAQRILQATIHEELGLVPGEYALLCLERSENTSNPAFCDAVFRALAKIERRIPVVFPAAMRTVARLHRLGVWDRVGRMENVRVIEHPRYLDHAALIKWSRMTLTDSGNIQDETTAMRVPCLTLSENTDRPVTVSAGSNTLVGRDPDRIVAEAMRVLRGDGKTGRIPPMWDGRTAPRVVKELLREREMVLERYRNVRVSHLSKRLPDRAT